jgi:serine/threonine protein kinase
MTVALGRYRLVERVGRGCLTEAFLAKSFGVEGFEKAVLVKLLNADHADDPERLETFIREARRSMALSHANVVQVVDLGSAELEGRTRHFIVTEAVRGESLAVVLEHARARGAAMPASVAVGIAAEIARALEHAHRRSAEGRVVAHGALSPRQIFVTPEGAIKVADFCIRAPAREPTEADDLAALGDMLSAIAAELGSPIGELQVLADDLRGARPPRATEAHERLLVFRGALDRRARAGDAGDRHGEGGSAVCARDARAGGSRIRRAGTGSPSLVDGQVRGPDGRASPAHDPRHGGGSGASAGGAPHWRGRNR